MNKTTFAERLKLAMKEKEFTQASLAEAVGMAQPSVWKLTSGKANGSRKTVEIAKALQVDPEWLATGNGDMIPNIEEQINDRESSSQNNKVIKQFGSKETSCSYKVDLLDIQASAGFGVMVNSEFIETICSIEYTEDEARKLFGGKPAESIKMLTVNGDSMSGTFEPRDQIFVDITKSYFDGDGIYIFVLDNQLYIKRLQLQYKKLAIISDNKKYETWYLDEEESQKLYIQGKVMVSQSITYRYYS
ncbi:XRE family transcriptional regulator [Xenorhabdus kozodoii]|uniref:Transcriptional regulator n=1 Tax=Xenorhabdus kozodoii TaxID=351676 RepID=A0A2D0KZW3_9GAMM|nr:helix-turn-helix transcriptional regulator [Xenorhabdus kozodoii]PHM68845.1 transcriptional regulator [Xenorhabdus kozodoii]